MKIYEDEAFPVFTVSEPHRPGGVDLPDDALTPEELGDLQRVEALYDAWQERLKVLYWDLYWNLAARR